MESAPGGTNRAVSFFESHNGQRVTIAAFSIVSTLVLMLLPGGPLAYVFGLPYMFFVPGFALVRMFFWKGTSLEAKFVLSLGLSILVVIFLAFVLVLTPIGLASESAIGSLVVFTLAAVALETAWLKADRPRKDEAKEKAPQPALEPAGKPDKVVAAMIATALIVSGISLGLIVTADYPSRTSFSITDASGKVITNTTRVQPGSLDMVFHVKNGEDGPRNFTVVAYSDNAKPVGFYPFETKTYHVEDIARGNEWSQHVMVYFNQSTVYRINFDLYIETPGITVPAFYGSLHMWFEAP